MEALSEIYRGFFALELYVLAFLAVLAAAYNLLQCFFGYRFFRFFVAVMGFLFFFGVTLGILAIRGSSDVAGTTMLICVVAGIIGGLIAFKLYLFGVFVLAALAGFFVAQMFFVQDIGMATIVIMIIAGVVGVMFVKPAVIISTSVSGGLGAGRALASLLKSESVVWTVIGVVLAVLGLAVQFRAEKKKNENAETNVKAATESFALSAAAESASGAKTAPPDKTK